MQTKNPTKNPVRKTAPKIGDLKEFTELYQTISSLFEKCEPSLIEAKNLIEATHGVKTPTKKLLVTKLDSIFSDMGFIVDKLGKMGKVK